MIGDLFQLGEQGLLVFIVIVDDQCWGDGFKLIVQWQGGVVVGCVYQDQIWYLGGYCFGVWFVDVQLCQFVGFGNFVLLVQKVLVIGDVVVWCGCVVGDYWSVNCQQ